MRRSIITLLVFGAVLSTIGTTAFGEDAKGQAIQKDRQRIHGAWRAVAVEISGSKAKDEDAGKLIVVNGSDGTWSLHSEGKEISKGTSTIDPTQNPKTIDFTPNEGAGNGSQFLGIYELGETTRRLCFAPKEKGRPAEFVTLPDSENILVTFERNKTE